MLHSSTIDEVGMLFYSRRGGGLLYKHDDHSPLSQKGMFTLAEGTVLYNDLTTNHTACPKGCSVASVPIATPLLSRDILLKEDIILYNDLTTNHATHPKGFSVNSFPIAPLCSVAASFVYDEYTKSMWSCGAGGMLYLNGKELTLKAYRAYWAETTVCQESTKVTPVQCYDLQIATLSVGCDEAINVHTPVAEEHISASSCDECSEPTTTIGAVELVIIMVAIVLVLFQQYSLEMM